MPATSRPRRKGRDCLGSKAMTALEPAKPHGAFPALYQFRAPRLLPVAGRECDSRRAHGFASGHWANATAARAATRNRVANATNVAVGACCSAGIEVWMDECFAALAA